MIYTKFVAPNIKHSISLKYETTNNKLQTIIKFKIQNSKQLWFYELKNLGSFQISDFRFQIFIIQGVEL